MSSSKSLVIKLISLLIGFCTTATYAVATPAEAAASAAKAVYPLKTCVVSGGKLGSMGKPVEYVHRQAGEADVTVFFCCNFCIKKFEKDPAKYLAKFEIAETPSQAATKK